MSNKAFVRFYFKSTDEELDLQAGIFQTNSNEFIGRTLIF